ncbi:MAG: class D sortase, partial [Chloroflexota bacterium]
VIGLVYLGFELITGIRVLEDQTAEAQQEIEAVRAASVPTLAPTPVLSLDQVVLPGGHKFVEGQTPTLNIDEIPENVRFAVADQILRPVIERPPATDETPLRLTVPKLNIDQTIVQGADWEALKQGVGYILNGVTPSAPTGTVALTAHNDIYGELFKNIDQLEPGDQFQVQTREQVYLYEITGTEVVDPTDVHVLNDVGRPQAILISCYPYRVNTQRIVVYADRVDT